MALKVKVPINAKTNLHFLTLLCDRIETRGKSLFAMIKKVMLGTKFKRCVQQHELHATDCYFLGGFVQSNLSKPCAIPSISFLTLHYVY